MRSSHLAAGSLWEKVVAAWRLQVCSLCVSAGSEGGMPEDNRGCLRTEVVVGNAALLPKGQLAAQAFTSWAGSRS